MSGKDSVKKDSLKVRINNWYKSKSKKSLILMGIFLIALPIGAGVGVGIAIDKFFIGKQTDYSNLAEEDLLDDQEEIMNRYNAAKLSETEYSKVLEPSELVNVGYNLFSNYENSISVTKGKALAAIVDQSIRAASIRNKNEYLEESISKSSIVSVASRTYLHQNEQIEYYKGEVTSVETAKWNVTPTQYNLNEYKSIFGKTPKTPLIYIVSKKTVISSENKVNKTDNGYEVNLTLHSTKSVINYVKQMKNLSNLDDYPSFESVKATFFLSNDLLIKKLNVSERYYAKTNGVGTDIDANLSIEYQVGGSYSIPTLSQNIDYGVSSYDK